MAFGARPRECPFDTSETGAHDVEVLVDQRDQSAHVRCSCGARGPIGTSEAEALRLWGARSSDVAIRLIQAQTGKSAITLSQRAADAEKHRDDVLTSNTDLHERLIAWRHLAESHGLELEE